MLSKNKFRLSMILPSMKFSKCQAVFRNSLRSSPNDEIKPLWKSTNSGMNIQCDHSHKKNFSLANDNGPLF